MSTSAEYKDRSDGLIIFGLLTILFGGACFVPAYRFVQGRLAAQAGGGGVHIVPDPVMPMAAAIIGLFLVVAGLGSLRMRRWARALLLAGSCWWLAGGVFYLVQSARAIWRAATVLRGVSGGGAGLASATPFVTLSVIAFFAVVLPIVWIVFYRGRQVKATCEALDPVPRWTDPLPLPLLTALQWLAFAALIVPGITWASNVHVVPFFGVFLLGPSAVWAYLIFAAVCAVCAWGFARRDLRAWWLAVAAIGVFACSRLVTYSRRDVTDLYRTLGYSEHQIDLVRKTLGPRRTEIREANILSLALLGYFLLVGAAFRQGRVGGD